MKKYIPFLFFLLVSCSDKKTYDKLDNSQNTLDSLLSKNSKNLQISDTIQKKSDSTTQIKVQKVVKQIQFFTKEIEKFKTERIYLLNEIKVAKENVIVRVDTVFVESKKNFWGKEKTTVNTKSDTKLFETVDSTTTEKKVIDTTNHQ